ncbi:UDP-3-O-acyl-N-acetylglucosamine deacetylase [Thermoproteota archaeon]
MKTEKQKTIKQVCSFSGIGLHSGKTASFQIKPAQADTGIVFQRRDLENARLILSAQTLGFTPRATLLKGNKIKVYTPEHLLAACFGLGLDNLIIELEGEEIPIMDGSAIPFVETLLRTGIQELGQNKNFFRIPSVVVAKSEDRACIALPYEGFKISFFLDYPQSFVGIQSLSMEITPEIFEKELASARTFGFVTEVEGLLERGLARGGSLNNSLIIGKSDYLTQQRYNNELVRHKFVDLLGDLAVIGRPLKGHFIGIKSGHSINADLVKKLSAFLTN